MMFKKSRVKPVSAKLLMGLLTAAVSLGGLVLPAHSGMVEVTLQKKPTSYGENSSKKKPASARPSTGANTDPQITNTTKEPGNQSQDNQRPALIQTCSSAYHRALGSINQNEWQHLNDVFRKATLGDKSLPGKFLLSSNGIEQLGSIRELQNRAKQIATKKGVDPWLKTRQSSWTFRQLVTDLKTYTTQEDNKYLCSGTKNYLRFLVPHTKRISGEISKAHDRSREMALFAENSAREAIQATNSLAASQPQGTSAAKPFLRSGLDNGAGINLDSLVTNTIEDNGANEASPSGPHPPARSSLGLTDDSNKLKIMQGFYEVMEKSGMVAMAVPIHFDRMSMKDAFDSWQLILSSVQENQDNFTLRKIKAALADLETLYYLQLGEQNLENLDEALSSNFSAIRTAYKENCTCSGLARLD